MLSFAGSSCSCSCLPLLLFVTGVVGGGGIEVEAEAAVDGGMHGLSCRDVPEDASPTGTGNSAAGIGEVEVDAAVD